MIVLFKFAVLVPGIGAFRAYWTAAPAAATSVVTDTKH